MSDMTTSYNVEIALDDVKRAAICTYRCARGCLLGYTSRLRVDGELMTVFASRHKGNWQATTDPFDDHHCSCRHVQGRLPVSDVPEQAKRGVVVLTQDEVRQFAPGRKLKE